MDSTGLLQQLKDIRPPLEPAWWLLSPAVLSLLLLALLAGLVIAWLQYRRHGNALVELAARELREIAARIEAGENDRELSLSLGEWLKRVAMVAFPERDTAALTGQRWLDFLDESAGCNLFGSGIGRVFAGAVYRPVAPASAGELLPLCESWLRAVRPRLRQRGRQ